MLVSVTLVGDRQLVAKFEGMTDTVRANLYQKSIDLALRLQRYIQTQKLDGQVLNRVTGALARSIFNKVEQTEQMVIGTVFSSGDVKYARIHEYGGTTAAHVIMPKQAGGVLAFTGSGGGTVFARSVNHPGSKMPERSFMRSGLRDMSMEISQGLKLAVLEGIKGTP